MDSKMPSLLLKTLFGECGFGSAAKWIFWNFILDSDYPLFPGQSRTAEAGSQQVKPPTTQQERSPECIVSAGRQIQWEERGRRRWRGQICYCGEFCPGDNMRWVNKSPLTTPAVASPGVDETWPCSPETLGEKGDKLCQCDWTWDCPSLPFFTL